MSLTLARALVEIGADTSELAGGIASVTRGATRSIGSLVKVAAVGGGIMAGMFATAVVAQGVQMAAAAEQTAVQFSALAGSAEAGQRVMGDLGKMFRASTFEMPQLQEAAKRLLSANVAADQVLPTISTLGDLSKGTGTELGKLADIYAEVKNKGVAGTEALGKMMKANVPIVDALAKELGVSRDQVMKMAEDGEIGFGSFHNALVGLTSGSGQFAGAWRKDSNTFMGQIERLKRSFSGVLLAIGQAVLPLVKTVTSFFVRVMAGAAAFVSNWGQSWELIKVLTALALSRVIDFASNGFNLFIRIIAGFIEGSIAAFNQWLISTKIGMGILLQIIMNTLTTIKDMFVAIWSDGTIIGAWKAGIAKNAELASKLIEEDKKIAKAFGRAFGASMEGAPGLFDASRGSRALSQQAARLRGSIFGGSEPEIAGARMGAAAAKTFVGGPAAAAGGTTPASAAAAGVKSLLDPGRTGFVELGRKIQEALLKDSNQEKMVGLLARGVEIQSQQLVEMKRLSGGRSLAGGLV